MRRVTPITGAAKPNIVVRIASSPIQVERERSCVGRIIPIPTTDEDAAQIKTIPKIQYIR